MREECPRPDFVHESGWRSLNGTWEFAFDPEGRGERDGYIEKGVPFPLSIEVPFAPECALSGIGDTGFHDRCYYRKRFVLERKENRSYRITFMAVDYSCEVYVNRKKAYSHVGGATAFSFLLDPFLVDGENEIALRVDDPGKKKDIPRGKQYWEEESEIIWYTRTTGIYRSVYLEELPSFHLAHAAANGSYAKKECLLRYEVSRPGLVLEARLLDGSSVLWSGQSLIEETSGEVAFDLGNAPVEPWSPNSPRLYELELSYGEDKARTRVGFRDVEARDGKVYLNGEECYLRLVLDQGYYPGGNLTAPRKEDFLHDIRLAKEMGFNGARVHQKTPDPWFYRYADEEGFLLWTESPSCFLYSPSGAKALEGEWSDIVKDAYGHPSVIAYTPNNESWGIDDISREAEQLAFAERMYRLLKELDPSRLVISNDGWENPLTDLVGIHDYSDDEPERLEAFKKRLSSKERMVEDPPNADRPVFAPGREQMDKPFVLSEYGGIPFNADDSTRIWGYGSFESREGFLARYRKTQEAVASSPYLAGYCYTQLYDVEQEINGLLTFDRKPKADVKIIKEINGIVPK